MSSFFGFGKTRTFKPRKDIPEGTKQYQLRKYAEATLVRICSNSELTKLIRLAFLNVLDGSHDSFYSTVICQGSGNLRMAVLLPEGEDVNEWLAVHAVDFFNHLNMLYGTVTEFCIPQEVRRYFYHRLVSPNFWRIWQCPVMSAGPRYEYLWEDGVKFRRATKLPAPEYVDTLMNWVQSILDDEAIFPNKIGVPFPRTFRETVRTIFRRLFRVYGHIYSSHFDQICALGIEAHLNTSYRHFFLFVNEFDLVDKKELAPLSELNDAILVEDKGP